MVHQQLLNILIGKAGIVQRVPIIGQPMAAILRALEEIVDVSLLLFKCPCVRLLTDYRLLPTASST